MAVDITVGLPISMDSPFPVTTDSKAEVRAICALNGRLDTLNSPLNSINE